MELILPIVVRSEGKIGAAISDFVRKWVRSGYNVVSVEEKSCWLGTELAFLQGSLRVLENHLLHTVSLAILCSCSVRE